VRHHRRYTVEVVIEVADDQRPVDFDDLFAEYLTTDSYPFLTDYGPHSWGGFEGPLVHAVNVATPSGSRRWVSED
jgi:hypothetical protein